jgi:hypothetical protein
MRALYAACMRYLERFPVKLGVNKRSDYDLVHVALCLAMFLDRPSSSSCLGTAALTERAAAPSDSQVTPEVRGDLLLL